MKLEKARAIGMDTIGLLSPGAERIVMAGSVRREKAEVGDLEIVYLARYEERQVDLFTVSPAPVMEEVLAGLMAQDVLMLDQEVRRNGAKYKRLIHVRSGLAVDLFRAEEGNWGLILALRTGPADFMRLLVTRFKGAMPVDMGMKGGWLWRWGLRVETPEEEDFFRELEVPCWRPEERSVMRLGRFLFEQGRARGPRSYGYGKVEV